MEPIPAGHFTMGQAKRNLDYKWACSLEIDQGADWDEQPVREVEITKPFAMSSTEVTNAQYELFEPGHRASAKTNRAISQEDDAAVVNVSWDDAARYCQWLSEKEKKHYRLPTEAEWEYACRAGTTTFYHYGDALPEGYIQMNAGFLQQMNLYIPDKTKVPPYYVFTDRISLLEKRHAPNAWGLYDMHGNASEWCLDWYAPYDAKETRDPLGRKGNSRVVRGGSFANWGRLLRSANRSSMIPGVRSVHTGFRVVEGADLGEIEQPQPLPVFAAPEPVSPVKDAAYDPKQPLFIGPIDRVKIAPDSYGPLYSAHNHDSGMVWLPNGDVFAIWYTTVLEGGCELAVASSRLPAGSREWTPAEPFFDTADGNDHAPAIFVDENTIFHFNLTDNWNGSWVRTSTDLGHTWSQFRPYAPDRPYAQPNEANIKTHDGRLLGTLDGANEASIVMESRDHGNTWTRLTDDTGHEWDAPGGTGKAIAGIHTGLVELADGTLFALGRMDNEKRLEAYQYKMPQSISTDGGRTWRYGMSELPAITSSQRLTLKKLKNGALLLCSFTDRLVRKKAEEIGKVGFNTVKSPDAVVRADKERDGLLVSDGKGGEFRGYGLYAAISWDEGKTWPVKRLVLPEKLPAGMLGTDGSKWKFDHTHAEYNGYMAMAIDVDDRVHLDSSRNYYEFNVAWLTQGTPYAGR